MQKLTRPWLKRGVPYPMVSLLAAAAILAVSGMRARADFGQLPFLPGNLVVSRSVYDNNSANVTVGEQLPPKCTSSNCVSATANGSYPQVFNNALVDGSFGITSRIYLDQITPFGFRVSSLEVPNSHGHWVADKRDQLVTSFSSKSELSLNRSLDGRYLTFMGYVAPVDALDVSNSNTPAVVDPTNPVTSTYYRAVAQMDWLGHFHFTETNAYSGNNGRAAILDNLGADDFLYAAGNAGNGSTPQPDGVILGAGAQFILPETIAEAAQDPGLPTPLGSFSVTQLGDKADKAGKDDNFRGLAVFNNVVYYTKGSGGNGVNTVYFVDTTGSACPNGVGLPSSSAALPISAPSFTVGTNGLTPSNMCVLQGFPTTLAKKALYFPFGLWFANATTVYVADEGDGTLADAGSSTTAGLEKWTYNSTAGQWQLAYVLQNGLNLGVPYQVPGYPTGTNPATGVVWAPETDGLRNLTGEVNRDGSVTIYAITSTVSGSGDQGADPNKLMLITDQLSATTLPAWEKFRTLVTAGSGEVLRGVSWTPKPGW